MPITIGTNARRLNTITRWSLVLSLLAAPLALWWPSYHGWTALLIASGCLLLGWLCWRTTAGRTDVTTHPLQLALLGLIGLETWRIFAIEGSSGGKFSLHGVLDVAAVTHLALLSLLLMLTGDLLRPMIRRAWLPTALGAATITGAIGGLCLGEPGDGEMMLALMGWTGVAIFCWPAWSRRAVRPTGTPTDRWRTAGRYARIIAAITPAAALAALCPPAVAVVAGAVALTLFLGAFCLHGMRLEMALASLLAAVSAIVQASTLGWRWSQPWPTGLAGWIGVGEQALLTVTPWKDGPGLIVAALGWGGALWLAGWLLICLCGTMLSATGRQSGGRALLGGLTAVLAAAAMVAPGGLFCPAVNVTFVLAWAALPMLAGRRAGHRSGWWALVTWVLLATVLGLGRKSGHLRWFLAVVGGDDRTLHILFGWLTTQVLLWRLGLSWRGALVAVGVSLAVGAGGEAAQRMLSTRNAQLGDLAHHLVGVAIALTLYTLCKISLWCEPAR